MLKFKIQLIKIKIIKMNNVMLKITVKLIKMIKLRMVKVCMNKEVNLQFRIRNLRKLRKNQREHKRSK